MTHAETLIAKLRELGHADAELARRLGISRGQFANIASGHDKLSPELAALMADLAGIDAQEAAARQMVENAKEPRRSMLERALFTFGALGVALASIGTPTATDAKQTVDGQTTDNRTLSVLDSLYIVVHRLLGSFVRLVHVAAGPNRSFE